PILARSVRRGQHLDNLGLGRELLQKTTAFGQFKVSKIEARSDCTSTQAIAVGLDNLCTKPCTCRHNNLKAFTRIRTPSKISYGGGWIGKLVEGQASAVIEMPYLIRLDPVKQRSVGRAEEEENGSRETPWRAEAKRQTLRWNLFL